MLVKIGVAGIVLGLVVLAALSYLGAFAEIFVLERDVGPLHFVYRPVDGVSFREVGSITDEIGHALDAAGAVHVQALGLYYPDGSGRPNEIGFAVDETEIGARARLDPKYLQREISQTMSLTARFPFENPLSYVMGFYRVTKLLRAHRAAHHYQDGLSYTLHDGDVILYVQPIVK